MPRHMILWIMVILVTLSQPASSQPSDTPNSLDPQLQEAKELCKGYHCDDCDKTNWNSEKDPKKADVVWKERCSDLATKCFNQIVISRMCPADFWTWYDKNYFDGPRNGQTVSCAYHDTNKEKYRQCLTLLGKIKARGTFTLGTCVGAEPNLNNWNQRFVARMNQEWQKRGKLLVGKGVPFLTCEVSYKIGRGGPGVGMYIAVLPEDVLCDPDYKMKAGEQGVRQQLMRQFMSEFRIDGYPFPKGVMEGTEIQKQATFSLGERQGYTPASFADQTVQVTWPDTK